MSRLSALVAGPVVDYWSHRVPLAGARHARGQVKFRALAGGIGHALARLAEVFNADMIVVGSRRGGGRRTSMHEFFGGSVAVHLAYRQPRLLVVVPVSPTPQGRLPWEHHP